MPGNEPPVPVSVVSNGGLTSPADPTAGILDNQFANGFNEPLKVGLPDRGGGGAPEAIGLWA